MNLSGLIEQYGYAALFVGSLLEGETLLILAGFAAHQGFLQLPWVIVVAMTGGWAGDQIYFWLGRRHGGWVLSHFPRLLPVFERANVMIERYHELLIVGVRFLYGLRTVGPMALGMSAVPGWRFVLFNALGALIWAVGIGGAGYLFGQALELFLADVKKLQETLLIVLLFVGLLVWVWRRSKFRNKFK
jgi:membrane protein DedA with SNARE-associated domain